MRNQLIEIQAYYQSLIHVCQCQDESCQLSNCDRMKQIIYHTNNCKIRVKRDCPTCIRLIKICFYHAKYCYNADCNIPLCSRMKLMIMDEQLKERIKQAKLRRRRLVDMLRHPDQRASKRPPG